jgi:phage terminase small subunit
MPGLKNQRHETFCREYVGRTEFCGAKAARNAGYSEKGAREQAYAILRRRDVQNRLAELLQERRANSELNDQYVLDRLREVVDRCLQAVPVIDPKTGGRAGEWRFNASGANKALELLGRHLGLWNDKLSLQLTEAKAREILEKAACFIVRHVKDPTVLAALRADLADLLGGGDA